MAIQLAKLLGLRVIAVADVAKHGSRLVDLGADLLVDRQDPVRAIEIVRNVTKGKLRYSIDTVGKETATHLQEALQQPEGESQAHLVGLTGLPKARLPGIRYHTVPIKVFHTVPSIGEQTMIWLEQLLVKGVLQPPEIQIADGGLEGINEALDSLRTGSVSGKRIVVPVTQRQKQISNGYIAGKTTPKPSEKANSLEYADKLNSDPDRVKFA